MFFLKIGILSLCLNSYASSKGGKLSKIMQEHIDLAVRTLEMVAPGSSSVQYAENSLNTVEEALSTSERSYR